MGNQNYIPRCWRLNHKDNNLNLNSYKYNHQNHYTDLNTKRKKL